MFVIDETTHLTSERESQDFSWEYALIVAARALDEATTASLYDAVA